MAFLGMSHGFKFDSEDNYRLVSYCLLVLLRVIYHLVITIVLSQKLKSYFSAVICYSLLYIL